MWLKWEDQNTRHASQTETIAEMKNFPVPTHLITMGYTAAQSYFDLKMNHDQLK